MADNLRRALRAFRLLNLEQRAAAVAALLLIVSTFGPFSFVEAAEILIGAGVLALLFARAEGKRFHLPFGDGTAIAAAGIWAGLLIVVRLFDRSLGQNLLALACAAILFLAGARERAKRPADDLPPAHATSPAAGPPPPPPSAPRASDPADDETEPLPPPESDPGPRRSAPGHPGDEPRAGEQLRLADDRDDEAGS
jgi:hypothetical protein